MGDAAVLFDAVWKKFRRGERHDSLRDLLPATVGRLFGRRDPEVLDKQEFWAVKDVSFEVKRGEALGIIGPNGAGKSTALKLLTRILRPTRGHCEVRGRVGALIEVAAGFHPDLTGRENVYLQGAIMGMKQTEIAARFDDIVDFSGISDFIDTQIKRYSSGMNARLGFAIAAHLNPEVLFIDEVLAVGDASFQQRCFERLEQLKQNGVALVFVSHNLPAVEVLCQRALLLNGGENAFLGNPREAVARHLTPKFSSQRGSSKLSIVRTGDHKVEITRVAIKNSDGVEVTGLPSGEAAVFEFLLECREGPAQLILGIQLLGVDRRRIFGENTTVSMPPLVMNTGDTLLCRLAIESLALHEGRYYLTVEAQSPTTNSVYDAHEAAYAFEIEAPQEYNRVGVLGLKTRWTLEKPVPSSLAPSGVGVGH